MRILWIHNFDPTNKFNGIFMKQMVQPLKAVGIDIDLYYIGKLRKEFFKLPQTIKKLNKICEGYDVIHAQYGSMTGYIVSRVDGTKVLSLRGSDWHRIRHFFPMFDYLHGIASTTFSKLALNRIDHVITMSNRMGSEVSNSKKGLSVYTLPDAIDLKRFKPLDYHEARKKLGIPSDQKWVVFASVLHENPIKRPHLAQEAVRTARKTFPNIVFKPLIDIPHKDMPYYYNAADAILTTSVHEGWPNCIKEALACNLPFVATETSDLAEIAAQEESCHVCADNPDDLAKALLETLSQDRPTELYKHVEHMSMEQFITDISDIYKHVLQNN